MQEPDDGRWHPAGISEEETAGKMFDRPDWIETDRGGHVTLDVTTLPGSDRKFGPGMYRSGKVRAELDEPHGVDEFMFFPEGGVTLTSADGTVQTICAGEA